MTSPISPMAGIDLQALAMAIVLRAPKLKSPVLGIPRPGFPPLAFNREIIANCVRGLTVTRVEWNEQLIIEGTRKHGRGCYKLNPLQVDYLLRERVTKWATQQRNNGMLSGGERQRVKGSKYAIRIRDTKAAIAKLEARMSGRCHRYNDRIDEPEAPRNPVVSTENYYPAGTEERQQILAWYQEKPLRKAISKIKSIDAAAQSGKPERKARWSRGRGFNTSLQFTGLYKALTAAGFCVKKYSEVKHIVHGRPSPMQTAYLTELHIYCCGLSHKPERVKLSDWRNREFTATRVKEIYNGRMQYIASLRKWQAAQAEIAGLRELLASHEQDAAGDA